MEPIKDWSAVFTPVQEAFTARDQQVQDALAKMDEAIAAIRAQVGGGNPTTPTDPNSGAVAQLAELKSAVATVFDLYKGGTPYSADNAACQRLETVLAASVASNPAPLSR